MIPNIEIGKIYKLSDANPPAFAKIIKISKYDKTVAEMEEAVNALYSDPHVFEAWYEEVAE